MLQQEEAVFALLFLASNFQDCLTLEATANLS